MRASTGTLERSTGRVGRGEEEEDGGGRGRRKGPAIV